MTQRIGWLSWLSALLSACTLMLIVAGGLVTSHEAGLAVPDWPLSYGQFFPPMVGNIFWEHGHRMVAGFVGLFCLFITLCVQRFESRVRIRRLAWTAFATVIAQALLGGLTVLLMLPPAVSIAHACLGQTFFCLTLALAYFLSPLSLETRPHRQIQDARLPRLLMITTTMVYIQLLLGATIRHTGHGHAIPPHIILGFIVLIHSVLVLVRSLFHAKTAPLFSRLGIALAVITGIQIFFGFGSLVMTRMVERSGFAPSKGEVMVTVAHQSAGCVILGICLLMTLMVWGSRSQDEPA